MSLTYASFVTAVSTLMPIDPTDVSFLAILPDCIDYTEERILRELDLLQTVVRDSSAALVANSRNFTLPTSTGTFVVTNGMNVITPAGTVNPESGTRVPLIRVSTDFLDLAWPSSTGATTPKYFAMTTQTAAVVGPWPDGNYQVEVVGTQRPAPLSATNTPTFLSTNLPDLYLQAAMIFMTGPFMKNYGASSDNPQQAQSYENQYQLLKASAATEEFRKMAMGSAWTPLTQSPQAQPARN